MSASQTLIASPRMTLRDFFRLYLPDEDLGVRLVRHVNGYEQLTTLTLLPGGSIEIRMEVARPEAP